MLFVIMITNRLNHVFFMFFCLLIVVCLLFLCVSMCAVIKSNATFCCCMAAFGMTCVFQIGFRSTCSTIPAAYAAPPISVGSLKWPPPVDSPCSSGATAARWARDLDWGYHSPRVDATCSCNRTACGPDRFSHS